LSFQPKRHLNAVFDFGIQAKRRLHTVYDFEIQANAPSQCCL
jgi:hypothetical protein